MAPHTMLLLYARSARSTCPMQGTPRFRGVVERHKVLLGPRVRYVEAHPASCPVAAPPAWPFALTLAMNYPFLGTLGQVRRRTVDFVSNAVHIAIAGTLYAAEYKERTLQHHCCSDHLSSRTAAPPCPSLPRPRRNTSTATRPSQDTLQRLNLGPHSVSDHLFTLGLTSQHS